MSDAGDDSAAQAGESSGWAEPPWTGFIETTGDGLLILEAARRGIIPRVTRRLVDAERKMINSGAVFVFDEEESGIKRWTDGFVWSPSRILGNFLLYRETDKKPNARGRGKQNGVEPAPPPPPPPPPVSMQPREDTDDSKHGRALVGSLTDAQKFKSEGLMKKTFSLSIGGVAQHLISYYRPEDVESGRLSTPSAHPELSRLDISPEYLDKTHFRVPPRVAVGDDGIARYIGEAEELDLAKPAAPARSTSRETPTKRERRFNPVDKAKRPPKASKVKLEESADTKPFPQALYMQPLYGTYQPYYVGGDAGAGAWQAYSPYQVAPYGPGYAAQPPPPAADVKQERDSAADEDDADADADGDDDPDAAQDT